MKKNKKNKNCVKVEEIINIGDIVENALQHVPDENEIEEKVTDDFHNNHGNAILNDETLQNLQVKNVIYLTPSIIQVYKLIDSGDQPYLEQVDSCFYRSPTEARDFLELHRSRSDMYAARIVEQTGEVEMGLNGSSIHLEDILNAPGFLKLEFFPESEILVLGLYNTTYTDC